MAKAADYKRNISDWEVIKYFVNITTRPENRRYVYQAFLHPVGAISLNTFVPLYIGKVLASLASGGNASQYLPYMAMAALFGLICNRYGFRGHMMLQAKSMDYLQNRSLDVLLRRSVGFHNNNLGGKIISHAIDLPNAYQQLSNVVVLQIVQFVIVMVFGTLIIFNESWTLGLVILVMSTLCIGMGFVNSRSRIPLRHKRLAAQKDLTGHLADTITNVQAVKTFANEGRELSENKRLSTILTNHRLTDWTQIGTQGNNRMIVLIIMQFVFIVTIILTIQNNPALLGIGIFAFSFTVTLSNKLFEVDAMVRGIEDSLLHAEPMVEIIKEEPEIYDLPGAKDLKVKDGAITVDNIQFRYHDSTTNETIFSDLSLDIAAGEKIGLVGHSGGGKSTLTRLLLRFEDLDGGQITIDGQNIAEVTQKSLRNSIAYVPQEPLLFHRSIHDNISYGKDNATQAQVTKAAKLAHADDFIQSLPGKYETVVGERGVKLSGGQRQRVAIARAILKDAPILVLDEATSALDSESELLIQDALWKLMEGRTAIVIAHRLSTIQKMDRIVVLDEGKVVEQGSHKELLAHKGIYANLWKHQSGGFMEE